MRKRNLLILFSLFLTLAVGHMASALDEKSLCTGDHHEWSRQSYSCQIFDMGQNSIGENYQYQADYPTRIMFEPFIKDAIDALLQSQIDPFMQMVNESTASTTGAPPVEWYLRIDASVFRYSDNLFSVVFQTEEYTGGAHPFHVGQSVTFDRASDRVLTLQDLFTPGSDPLSLIVPFVRAELQADFVSDPGMTQFIEDGTQPDFANFTTFAVTDDAIIFFFPQYQVAPGAAGGQSVRMPFGEFGGLLQLPS